MYQNKKLRRFIIHLASIVGITLCTKCGARTKLDKKLGYYITESKSKCPKCGNIDHWGSALADLALRAASCFGADYAGVDIIQDPSGAPLVLEVNSMPAWQGLQRVTRTRIADSIVAPFLDACLGHTEQASAPRGREGA